MIDEYWTFVFYGYYSDELKTHSNKPIVSRCDGCCQYRISTPNQCRDLCVPCASRTQESRYNKSEAGKKRPPITDIHRQNLSKALKGKEKPPRTEEHCHNISKANRGRKSRPFTEEHRRKLSQSGMNKTISEDQRRKSSATKQGIPYEEWTGFVSDGEYCHLFDKACRERVRAKYDHRCFICDTPQDENINKNGKMIKLAVHHVDMNKDQGCNGNEWKLVPLCLHCHPKAHHQPMRSRLVYLIDNE